MKFKWSFLSYSGVFTSAFMLGFMVVSAASADTHSTAPKAPSEQTETHSRATRARTVATATEPGDVVKGKASWYGPGLHGKKTATGERFNSNAMTAASNRVALGSEVRVTNLKNGKTATVRINDCGPTHRKLDLSKKAARTLGMTHDGTAPVKAEVVSAPDDPETCADRKRAAR